MSETLAIKSSVFYRLSNFISDLFAKECDPEFTISIPDNIIHRTELICSYIRDEQGYDFEIENFLMLLYFDFIKNSIKNYNPKKVFEDLNKDFYKEEYIDLVIHNEHCRVRTAKYNKTNITMSMAKEDVKKGQLILDELYDLYGYRFQFSKLLENLWIRFIEDYKTGTNKRAYHSIVKLLKECLE